MGVYSSEPVFLKYSALFASNEILFLVVIAKSGAWLTPLTDDPVYSTVVL